MGGGFRKIQTMASFCFFHHVVLGHCEPEGALEPLSQSLEVRVGRTESRVDKGLWELSNTGSSCRT